ncbi:hypothetical protein CBS101457_001174 [Exobasidium rhododendri]|nr:hypothetical protein CBS101457_001174 [Exobasidium rhododendri]
MSSPIVNVARYSALVGGIGYGIVHQRTLQKREDVRAANHEKQYQEKLLENKRKEQDQKILAAVHTSGSGERIAGLMHYFTWTHRAVVSDPESPQFDLEKYLVSLEK